jgi:translation elongation factor EF-1beta
MIFSVYLRIEVEAETEREAVERATEKLEEYHEVEKVEVRC